jgi:hypothetical protein
MARLKSVSRDLMTQDLPGKSATLNLYVTVILGAADSEPSCAVASIPRNICQPRQSHLPALHEQPKVVHPGLPFLFK